MSEWTRTFDPTYTVGQLETNKLKIAIVLHKMTGQPILLNGKDITNACLSN